MNNKAQQLRHMGPIYEKVKSWRKKWKKRFAVLQMDRFIVLASKVGLP